MPNPRERILRELVETYGLHQTLNALIEVCYRKAQDAQDVAAVHGNWRRMAMALTDAEQIAYRLKF